MRAKHRLFIIAVLLAAYFLTLGSPAYPSASLQAYAAGGDNAALFDDTNVLDDLENSETEGQKFDVKDHPFNENEPTSLYTFVEFCYSFSADLQGDYGLYVYIHNPKGLQFDTESERNTISLRAGSDASKNFQKYHLQYLNRSERTDYEGIFYKFKINLSNEKKQEILNTVSSARREYRIGDIELLVKGDRDVTLITVSTSYYFEGYAGGYGPAGNPESTLTISSEQKETLSLKPQPLIFLPDGSNGKDEYTKDCLHSVYFAVPNEFIATYGEMAAIHATWLNAVLAPALVMGDQSVYDELLPFLGVKISAYDPNVKYSIYGAGNLREMMPGNAASPADLEYGFGYNPREHYNGGMISPYLINGPITSKSRRENAIIDTLYTMFLVNGSAAASAVSPETILEKLLLMTEKYRGELVAGKYSRSLFGSVDDKFTDLNISREEEYDLTQEKITKDWWDKLFGLQGYVTSTTFDGIPAIYPLKETDFSGTDHEISLRLYVDEGEIASLKSYFENNRAPSKEHPNGCTVYIFRYQKSEYVSEQATVAIPKNIFGGIETDDTSGNMSIVTDNAYFFQETVNLDFDLIDVTFSNGVTSTVIPVAMSPIDILPGGYPPPNFTTNKAEQTLLQVLRILLAVALLALIGFAVYKLVSLATLSNAIGGKNTVNTTVNVSGGTSSSKKKKSSQTSGAKRTRSAKKKR